MVTLDWIFLGILLLSVLIGAWRGLVYEVLSLASWVLAFFVARHFAPTVATSLPMGDANEVLRYAAAFALIFVVAVFVGSVLIWLVSKLFKVAGLRPADRALGAVFGLLRGLVVLLAMTVLVSLTPYRSDPMWTRSHAATWATAAVTGLRPMLPREIVQYLP